MTLAQSFITKAASDADPAAQFKFWVEMKSVVVAEFKECSGLRLERDVERIEEGGVNDHVISLPGRSRQTNITLKHGVMQGYELWTWYGDVLKEGKVTRQDISILLRNTEGKVVRCWNVTGAFPVKWEGPTLNVESSQVAVESLEIAHNGLTLDTARIGT